MTWVYPTLYSDETTDTPPGFLWVDSCESMVGLLQLHVGPIKARIGMAKNSFNQKKELFIKSLKKDLKKRIIQAIIKERSSIYTPERL